MYIIEIITQEADFLWCYRPSILSSKSDCIISGHLSILLEQQILLEKYKFGDIHLPSYWECLQKCGGSVYDLDKIMNVMKDRIGIVFSTQLFEKNILPLNSDPTDEDTDHDGLIEGKEIKKNNRIIAPGDLTPLKVNGHEGMWKEHINNVLNNDAPSTLIENINDAKEDNLVLFADVCSRQGDLRSSRLSIPMFPSGMIC